jgi:hypothetical protein
MDYQPFMVNSGLSMGFTAAATGGASGLTGDANCGQCYELKFEDRQWFSGGWPWGGSHPDLVGKTHIVQVTNIGYDVNGDHSFDLQIPSAGMGAFKNGCPNQFPSFSKDAFDCGTHFGGCKTKADCATLPSDLRRGCEWRFDWLKWQIADGQTNNPWIKFRRVKCPSQLTQITGTIPNDDDQFPSINPDDYDPDKGSTTCSQNKQNCQTTQCCSDIGFTCYEKNQWWAECMTSCTPGIDDTEAPQFRTPWSCKQLGNSATSGIQSGDTIFLKTLSGWGPMLGVDGVRVEAKGELRGDGQAFKIETNKGGKIVSGDTVYLDSHVGSLVHVDGKSVEARWNERGTWQSLIIQKPGGGDILSYDTVCFKSHTGKYIETDPQSSAVGAHWEECAYGQGFQIEKEDAGAISSGNFVHLEAHTQKMLEVESEEAQARYSDDGSWQRFQIKSLGGRAIFSGDKVFFIAHTGKLLDVEGTSVRARYRDEGRWQQFSLERAAGRGAVLPKDVIHLRAQTGNYIETEGTAVAARWAEKGLWQALVIERASVRRILRKSSEETREGADGGWQSQVGGSVSGMSIGAVVMSVLFFVAVPAVKKRRASSEKVSDQLHMDSSTGYQIHWGSCQIES